MLELTDLKVEVSGKEILHGVNLTIDTAQTHILFGPNSAGKTTLLMSIMGFPEYKVTGGKILFNDEDVTRLPLHERARLGIGMSFQQPPTIKGLKTRQINLRKYIKPTERYEYVENLETLSEEEKERLMAVFYALNGQTSELSS